MKQTAKAKAGSFQALGLSQELFRGVSGATKTGRVGPRFVASAMFRLPLVASVNTPTDPCSKKTIEAGSFLRESSHAIDVEVDGKPHDPKSGELLACNVPRCDGRSWLSGTRYPLRSNARLCPSR